jgi:hypothetical protein
VFADRSSIGKIRDAYPIALFRLKHTIKLLRKRCTAEAIYLLPWTLAMMSLSSDIIAKETRRFLLELTLHFLLFFYTDQTERPCDWNEQRPAGSNVVPFKSITLKRAMATILGVILALDELDCDIPLDRISTHPLENFFGLLRRLLHDCNTFTELRHAAARNMTVNEIYAELGHPREICGRVNAGGIVSMKEGRRLPQPAFTSYEAAVQILGILQFPAPGTADSSPAAFGQMEKVLQWLEQLDEASSTKNMERGSHFSIRGTSNSRIMASFLQGRPRPTSEER